MNNFKSRDAYPTPVPVVRQFFYRVAESLMQGFRGAPACLPERQEHGTGGHSCKYQTLLRSSSDGLHILDRSGRLVEASQSFFWMLGYQREELMGKTSAAWWPDDGNSVPVVIEPLEEGEESCCKLEATFRRKDDTLVDVELTAAALEVDGEPHISLSARDVTHRKRDLERMRQLAFHDPLTGLPSRRLMAEHLKNAQARAQRFRRSLAVLYLDLDGFKPINDKLGHDVGDELLQEVAQRLSRCVRASDTVARVGGDEFVILLPEIACTRDSEEVAHKILNALEKPVHIRHHHLKTGTSIGISVFPENSGCAEDLLKWADSAMYEAKRAGGNCYRLARPPARWGSRVPTTGRDSLWE